MPNEPPRSLEKQYADLCNRIISVLPAKLVSETEDIDELVDAVGALLADALAVINAYGEDEGYTPKRVREQCQRLAEAGLIES